MLLHKVQILAKGIPELKSALEAAGQKEGGLLRNDELILLLVRTNMHLNSDEINQFVTIVNPEAKAEGTPADHIVKLLF